MPIKSGFYSCNYKNIYTISLHLVIWAHVKPLIYYCLCHHCQNFVMAYKSPTITGAKCLPLGRSNSAAFVDSIEIKVQYLVINKLHWCRWTDLQVVVDQPTCPQTFMQEILCWLPLVWSAIFKIMQSAKVNSTSHMSIFIFVPFENVCVIPKSI